jgi:hypothetical protein
MFVTAVYFLFLLKLKWPKNKSVYQVFVYSIGLKQVVSPVRDILKCKISIIASRAMTHPESSILSVPFGVAVGVWRWFSNGVFDSFGGAKFNTHYEVTMTSIMIEIF